MSARVEYTRDSRLTIMRAQDEAAALGHEYVGTEHLLLAMLHSPDASIATALDRMASNGPAVRHEVLSMLGGPGATDGAGAGSAPDAPAMPFTHRAKRVLEEAARAAAAAGDDAVAPKHLFVGLLREGEGVAAAALAEQGITLADATAAFAGL